MKNRFFVINKEKIYAYIFSILTIVVIFFLSNLINSDFKETELTSSNSINNITNEANNEIGEAIYTSVPSNIENENTTNSVNE